MSKPEPKRQFAIVSSTGMPFVEFVAVPDIQSTIQQACDEDGIGRLEYGEDRTTFWVYPLFDMDDCIEWFKGLGNES